MYSLDLEAGQTVTIDVNANSPEDGIDSLLHSNLRVFDGDSNELAASSQVATPDELVPGEGDAFLEFTPEAAGTYYVGISNVGNNDYDPNVGATGSGWRVEGVAEADAYQLSFELSDTSSNGDNSFEPIFGTLDGDTIEVEGNNQLIFAGDTDDLIDASTGEGNNRIYAGSGDDTIILGTSDRIIAGDGNDAIFTTSGGDNTITGGAGTDQFWLASAELPESANIITDFTAGEDVIGIAGLEIGFADLDIIDVDGDVLISGNGLDLAILQGVAVDSLSEDNFAFA